MHSKAPVITWKAYVRFESLETNESEVNGLDFVCDCRPNEDAVEATSRLESARKLQVVIAQHIPCVLELFSSAHFHPNIVNTFG